MNELDLIKNYFAPLSTGETGAFGLTDDAAVLAVPEGMELVVTKDAISEGVHFIGNEPPALIARKLLRTNLSDLAAMGARPYGYFLALMLPEKTDEAWIKVFAEGLRSDQEIFGITLMGGDTTRTRGTLSLSLTALGLVPRGQALRRAGARIGDGIYVSGTIGDAALGLQVARCKLQVSKEADAHLLERYRVPSPRVELGQKLRGVATASIDVSDGLMQDLGHIAECSGIGAVVIWEDIPLSDAAKSALPLVARPHETIAAGGDDYELLFTAPRTMHEKLCSLAKDAGVNITRIGEIKPGDSVKLVDKTGREIYLERVGYNHFSSKR